jgi:RNA polymerase sigma factor (sigma-70 family)
MLNGQQKVILPQLCRLIGPSRGADLADGELLERFLDLSDSTAFAALVRRHGATVLGVCQRVLHNTHDAEDVFQATFLVLIRRGRSIAKREALGSWLYGVAYRLALKARADAGRRSKHEMHAASLALDQAPEEPSREDLRPVLDEEVNRLPDRYRRPIVLCYFEGKTYQEAARLLGWPAGTASVRLARARELLRTRLARRGLALSAGAIALGLANGTASATDVCLMVDATVDAARCFTAGRAAPGISAQVLALTEGVVKAMLLQKLKTLTGVILTVGLVCGGAGGLWRFAATGPAAAAEAASETPGTHLGASAGELLVAADQPDLGRGDGASRSATAEQPRQVPEAPAGPPPRALAPPAGEGAHPLQTRIGLFNMTRVLKASKKFQAIQTDQRAKTQTFQEKLERMKKQFQMYQAEADNPADSASRREDSARQALQLKRQMEDEETSAKRLLTKANDDAIAKIYRDVEDAANRIAKLKGLELVLFYTDAVTEADYYTPHNLQRKLSTSALMPMIVAPGMDITDTVIEAIDRRAAPSEGQQP